VRDGENGWLFTLGDDAGFRQALHKAILDPDLQEKGRQGRALVTQKYSWEQVATQYLEC